MGSLLIKNVKILLEGNTTTEASIIIEDDKISKIVKNVNSVSDYDQVIDGKGLLALPGGIDIHAHVYDPDYTHHEDFRTGSIAAAYGSITTFYDMPLRLYVEDLKTLEIKVREGLRSSFINFGVIAGMMNEDNLKNVEALRKSGVKGFKLFTCKPFRPRHDATFGEVLKTVDSVDGITMVHAEDDAVMEYLVNKFRKEGRNDPLAHHESRPPEAEAAAIRRITALAELLGTKVHIVHVSSGIGAEEVRLAKKRGVKITAETCPHYLHFTKDDVRKWGNYLKMNPALKTMRDVEALWKALADGTIDAVTSDHAPSPREEKEVDVWDAWGGIPGLETMFPLIFTRGVRQLGILSLERYVEVTSRNPAKIMGIYPRKGELAVGSDADIVIIDPNQCFEVKAENLHHKVDWTPYEGTKLCVWPVHVLVNGKPIILDKDLIEKNKSPRFIKS